MHSLTPIFAAILPLFVTRTLGTSSKLQYPDDLTTPLYVACGGALNASTSVIAYKPNTLIAPNERCVWTIRSMNTAKYTLDVLSFGLQPQPGETGVTVSCIAYFNYNVWNEQLVQAGAVALYYDCQVLLITYYSGPNPLNSRGFTMLYSSIPGSSLISPNSMQYVINKEEGYIRHPPTSCTTYTNDEISSFVFLPPENIHNPDRKSLVTYSLNGLGEMCFDFIQVLKFSPDFGWIWNRTMEDSICPDVQFKSWSIDDLLMLVFRSNQSDVSYGFHLTYSSK